MTKRPARRSAAPRAEPCGAPSGPDGSINDAGIAGPAGLELPRETDSAAARVNTAGERAAILDVRVSHSDPTPAKTNHTSDRVVEFDIGYEAIAVQLGTGMPNRSRGDPEVISHGNCTGEFDDHTIDAQVRVIRSRADEFVAHSGRECNGR
jgi:hypothetical protein